MKDKIKEDTENELRCFDVHGDLGYGSESYVKNIFRILIFHHDLQIEDLLLKLITLFASTFVMRVIFTS